MVVEEEEVKCEVQTSRREKEEEENRGAKGGQGILQAESRRQLVPWVGNRGRGCKVGGPRGRAGTKDWDCLWRLTQAAGLAGRGSARPQWQGWPPWAVQVGAALHETLSSLVICPVIRPVGVAGGSSTCQDTLVLSRQNSRLC